MLLPTLMPKCDLRSTHTVGGKIQTHFDLLNVKDMYKDEYTNEWLPPNLVALAIKEEFSNIGEMPLVLCNKRDSTNRNVRAPLSRVRSQQW